MTTTKEDRELDFPEHKCGLYLEHNAHRDIYQCAKGWIEENSDHYSWSDENAKARAIETDSIWTLQWYPDTPVGFHAVASPTLPELMDFARALFSKKAEGGE